LRDGGAGHARLDPRRRDGLRGRVLPAEAGRGKRRAGATTAALEHQYVTVPDGVDPHVTFKRAEGPIRDGNELVSYGAALGVGAFFERAVAFDEPKLSSSSGVTDTLRSVLQRVEWIVLVLERIGS
jgi:hypothetical protein